MQRIAKPLPTPLPQAVTQEEAFDQSKVISVGIVGIALLAGATFAYRCSVDSTQTATTTEAAAQLDSEPARYPLGNLWVRQLHSKPCPAQKTHAFP